MFKRLHNTLTKSRKLGAVSDFAFRLWTNALTEADWYGRLPADPAKLRIICFPNRYEKVSENEIQFALDELADVLGEGLIHLYLDERGDKYLVFHEHEKSNPTGGWKTKPVEYPPPPRGLCSCIVYRKEEEGKKVGGKEFRFFSSIFQQQNQAGGSRATGHYSDHTTDHTCDQSYHHSPLLSSSSLQEGAVGGGVTDTPGTEVGKIVPQENPPVTCHEPHEEERQETLMGELQSELAHFKFPSDPSKLSAVEDLERQGVILKTIVETLKKNRKSDFLDIVRALKATVRMKVIVARSETRKPKLPTASSEKPPPWKDPKELAQAAERARKKRDELPPDEIERLRQEARGDPAAATLKGVLLDEFVESRVLTIVAERYSIVGL